MNPKNVTAPDEQVEIQNERPDPTFFAMVPNMAIDDLGPYELRLYCTLKRIGKCYMANATIAKKARMSVTKLKEARRLLEEAGYITVERHYEEIDGKLIENRPVTITINDIWAENHSRYQKGGGSPKNGGGSLSKTGGSLSKTPNKDSFELKVKSSAPPDGHADSAALKSNASASKKPAPRPAAMLNPIKDAIVEAFGWSWETIGGQSGAVQKAAAGIYDAGLTGAGVPLLYKECVRRGWSDFSPLALLKVIPDVLKPKPSYSSQWRPAANPAPEPPVVVPTPEEMAQIKANALGKPVVVGGVRYEPQQTGEPHA